MLKEIANERLGKMEACTVEKFDLLAELHWLKLGEAIAKSDQLWPDSASDGWACMRDTVGEDRKVLAFVTDKYSYSSAETNYSMSRVHADAAKILRVYGVSSEDELPEGDREMFSRWVEAGEGFALGIDECLYEMLVFPVHPEASDRMLSALWPDFRPDELRESAKRNEGDADLIEIRQQKEIQAMSEGLRAQFGRRRDADERMRRHLKAALTADLSGGGEESLAENGTSDARLIAVSEKVLVPEEHSRLMTEIEIEYPGWCGNCGTMSDRVGCDVCGARRRLQYAQEGSRDPGF